MELKDKLKQLRNEHNLSQQALADAIFVSRSAVAKWVNGLGLPGEDSMAALISYFGLPADYYTTPEPEVIIVEKNQTIRRLSVRFWTGWIALAVAVMALFMLYLAGYHLTSLSAAGEFCSDWPCIRTPDYDFYLDDPEYPRSAREVKKHGLFYKTVDGSVQTLMTSAGKEVAQLHCFEGKEQNYYFFWVYGYVTEMGTTEDGKSYSKVEYPYFSDYIILNGQRVELEYYCYFATDEPIQTLQLLGEELTLIPLK